MRICGGIHASAGGGMVIKRDFTLKQVYDILEENRIEFMKKRTKELQFDGFSSLYRSEPGTLTWVRDADADLSNVKATAVICPFETPGTDRLVTIRVKEPEHAFATVLKEFDRETITGINRMTSFIDKTATIGKNVSLGHNVVIGPRCEVGDNTVISHNVVLLRDVKIGRDCNIQAGTVIGEAGFSRAYKESAMRWPHLAGVTIGDRVQICSNVTIHRGVLYNTLIDDEVMIDNLVHVAHGVQIGKRTMITASVEISGSAVIGEDCWLAPGAIIRNGVTVGNRVLVGMGAVVTKNIPDDLVVMGVPARPR